MKKRLFFLLAFFSVFLICSISIIPSAQSSIVKEEINNKINNIINLFVFKYFKNFIVLWLLSAVPITIIYVSILLINGITVDIRGIFGLYYFFFIAPYYIVYLIFNIDLIPWDYIDFVFLFYCLIGLLELIFIIRGLNQRII